VVTNLKTSGDQVIWWLRARCGKSEEVHSVLKSDLAGGQLPSGPAVLIMTRRTGPSGSGGIF